MDLSPVETAAAAVQKPQAPQSSTAVVMKKQQVRPLNAGVTRMLFLSMCLAFLLIHLDDGILSVASEHIIRDFKFTEADLGLIEAAVYLGTTLGCLLCPFLFAHMSPKLLILFGVLSTSCCVSAWVFFDSFWFLAGARFMNGIFLSMQIIFYPVWIDESAPTPTSQTMWIAAFFLCEQVGVATGQGALNVAIMVFGEHGWRWSFLAESALLGGLTWIMFLVIPGRYYTQGKDTEEGESLRQTGQDQPIKDISNQGRAIKGKTKATMFFSAVSHPLSTSRRGDLIRKSVVASAFRKTKT